MAARCFEVVQAVEKLAPPTLAEEWDNCGLLLGDPAAPVEKVLVALDATAEVAGEAEALGAQMLVVHHPPIFDSIREVRYDRPTGRLLRRLIKADLAVYACHTSLDNAPGGVGDALASRLGLEDVQPFGPGPQEELFKLVVFVPAGYEEKLRDALGDAGAGWIGNYSHCTFRAAGTGTFRPLEGSNPFIGKAGQLEEVNEFRLETIVPSGRRQEVLKAMLRAHPYEEVAYDLIPLANPGRTFTYGRLGRLPAPLPLGELARQVRARLGARHVRLAGDARAPVHKVAVAGGAGAGLIRAAVRAGAQVLVTADVKYHQAEEALERGLAVLDAGHYATERPAVDFLAAHLTEALGTQKVLCLVSQVNSDPWSPAAGQEP